MVNLTILAGGYTSFVATYLFNTDTNALSLVSQSTTGDSPSWITSHPTNKSILYAVNEVTEGALQSFTVLKDGSLSAPVDTISSGGNGPPFAGVLSTGQVAVMNYGDGTGRIIPTEESDRQKFIDDAPTITFPKPATPTGVSHPHMAVQHGSEVFVPDLGGDKIWRLGQTSPSSPGSWAIHGFIAQPSGSGPRHIAIQDDLLFTIHELSSTLTMQAIPAGPNGTTTPLIANVSVIPDIPAPGASWAAGEILIPEPSLEFPTAYIYASNRNVGTQTPQGDSVAIFERVPSGLGRKEGLRLVKQVFTGIDQIRGMEFSPVTKGGEQFLVASGVAGTAGVKVYKRVDGGRDLKEVAVDLTIPTRTSFVWLEL